MFIKKHLKSFAGVTALIGILASQSYAAGWFTYLKTHYDYAPAPSNFTNTADCTWVNDFSTGGWGGVYHHYYSTGSCAYSEQEVIWNNYPPYNNTEIRLLAE